MVQDPLETAADSSNGSTGTPAHVTAQVVVNTTHSGQHTLVDSDAASTSAGTIVSGSPHFITVTGAFRAKVNFNSAVSRKIADCRVENCKTFKFENLVLKNTVDIYKRKSR